MYILLWLLLVAAVAAAALLLFASIQPKTFLISRAVEIHAPPDRIYRWIANLRAMNEWNPFVKTEPDLPCSYAGPIEGVGSEFSWQGKNSGAGAGRVEIVAAEPGRIVDMLLHMSKPMECHNKVRFELKQTDAGAVIVSWTMTGPTNLMSKVMGLFISLDGMVGGQFERGLRDLKSRAEQGEP